MSAEPALVARSLLFVPGDRPDMVAKVPRFGPDVAVVDLEDAVAAGSKEQARRSAVEAIDALQPGDAVVLVRVNPPGSPWFAADVAAAGTSRAAGVVLPKTETVEQVAQVRDLLDAHGQPDPVLVAGLETAAGVADCRALLAGGVTAAYFGAEDYIADIGGRRSADGLEVLYARSQVVLAATLAGVTPIDQAVIAVREVDRFAADAEAGRALGYQGKICVHPSQVALAHQVFTPSAQEVAHARAVLEAGRSGVGVLDGEMVDEVHLKMAATLLRRAGGGQPPGVANPDS